MKLPITRIYALCLVVLTILSGAYSIRLRRLETAANSLQWASQGIVELTESRYPFSVYFDDNAEVGSNLSFFALAIRPALDEIKDDTPLILEAVRAVEKRPAYCACRYPRGVSTCLVDGCDGKDCTYCMECGKLIEGGIMPFENRDIY